MEQLADVETVVLDKTGTITEGRPYVQKIKCFHGFTIEEVVYHTALLEQTSTHPLAHAILDEAKRRNLSLSQPNADAQIKEVTGKGLYGVKNERNIQVGSLSFLQDQGIQTKELMRTEQFSVYVAIDGKLAGAFLIQDTVRPGMKNTIKRMRLQGVKKVIMLTGDMQAVQTALPSSYKLMSFTHECCRKRNCTISKKRKKQESSDGWGWHE